MLAKRPPYDPLLAMRRKLILEYLAQPLHITLIAGLVYLFGGFRTKVAFDLVRRRQNAFAILSASDEAVRLGLRPITIIECGVASGHGLLNMCAMARRVTALTGVAFKVVGFDTGTGLPAPRDYRDHPEIFQAGDFPMDTAVLQAQLPSNVQLVLGDLTETVSRFLVQLPAEAPIGYVVIDVDYYWSAKEALKLLFGTPEQYLPYTWVYFDDVGGPTTNAWCGERLAIREFNEEHQLRKIELDHFLKYRCIYKDSDWLNRLYKLHVLDHSERQSM